MGNGGAETVSGGIAGKEKFGEQNGREVGRLGIELVSTDVGRGIWRVARCRIICDSVREVRLRG